MNDSEQDEVGFEPPNEAGLSIEMLFFEPQANSTVMETVQLDSGYATKSNEATDFVSEENMEIPEKCGNVHITTELDETVIEKSNVKGVLADAEVGKEKRQLKLTNKGKTYSLSQNIRKRKGLRREIQTQIANIGTLI